MYKLNEKELRQVLALKRIGLNTNQIAPRYNMSGSAVQKQVKKHLQGVKDGKPIEYI